MILELLRKVEFGHRRYYPRNKLAAGLLSILRRKSFTENQIALFADIGFSISITEPVDDVYSSSEKGV